MSMMQALDALRDGKTVTMRAEVNPETEIKAHGEFNKPGQGVKADHGKLQWALLPLKYLRGVVRVLMAGARKYSAHNWRNGMPWSQPYNAALRHLDAWQNGEDLDFDEGRGTMENHIDCAICELIFLRAFIAEHPELDDRYKAKTPQS